MREYLGRGTWGSNIIRGKKMAFIEKATMTFVSVAAQFVIVATVLI